MEEVVLYFGIISVVVVDSDIRFRGAFEEMCSIFQIKFCTIARINDKLNSVRKYQRFLNKYKLFHDNIVVVMTYLSKTQRHASTRITALEYMILT